MTTATQSAPPAENASRLPANAAKKSPPPAPQLRQIPLDCIKRSRLNPRKDFDKAALQELADSIQANGVLQPIVVRRTEKGAEFYEIVMGERRHRAAELAGLKALPAVVHEELADAAALEMALVENLQRRDMNAMEEAEGFARLQELMAKESGKKVTHDDLAERVGKARPTVTNALRLTELSEDVRETIRTGKLTAAHGLALLKFNAWPKVVQLIAKLILTEHVTAGQLEKNLPYDVRRALDQSRLLFDCNGYEFEDHDWVAAQKKNPEKFISLGDTLYCADVPWGKQQMAEAEKARAAAAKAAAEKLGKETGKKGKVLDLDKLEYADRKKWTALSEVPGNLRGEIPVEVKCAATEQYTNSGKPFTVIPTGLANTLKAKANRAKTGKLRAESQVVFACIEKTWGATTIFDGAAALKDSALVVMAHEILGRYSGKMIETAAGELGLTVERAVTSAGYASGAYGGENKVLDALMKLGGRNAVRLALRVVFNKEVSNALAYKHEKMPARVEWFTAKAGAARYRKEAEKQVSDILDSAKKGAKKK
ncbi:MAG TPA: ParB/RepB/Spo0J family partition protein [Opitutales bacterium]|nr:ParB/RepB/Spo0J family partition protein [Opitutales bacterium]